MIRRLIAALITVVALSFFQNAIAQTLAPDLKHFASRGLSFDYPSGVELDDRSSATGQHLIIAGKGRAQIMVVSRFAQINSPEDLADARREVVDSFIATMWKQIQLDDPNVMRTEARIDIGNVPATGIKMRAVLNNEPGNAEIYSLQMGPRLVLLTLIGSDREIAASAPAWLMIRRTLKIAPAKDSATVALQ